LRWQPIIAPNYLLDETGIQINAFMAASAWNLKKFMEILKIKMDQLFWLIFSDWFFRKFYQVIPSIRRVG
jgi:hypothetical protein